MSIEYSEHAELKIKEREIQKHEIEEIIKNPEEVFLDVETGNLVAVGDRKSKQGHKLIVVYSQERNKIVTVIDTSRMKIIKRRKALGRWVKIK